MEIKVNHNEGHFFWAMTTWIGVARSHGSRAGGSTGRREVILSYHCTVKVSKTLLVVEQNSDRGGSKKKYYCFRNGVPHMFNNYYVNSSIKWCCTYGSCFSLGMMHFLLAMAVVYMCILWYINLWDQYFWFVSRYCISVQRVLLQGRPGCRTCIFCFGVFWYPASWLIVNDCHNISTHIFPSHSLS